MGRYLGLWLGELPGANGLPWTSIEALPIPGVMYKLMYKLPICATKKGTCDERKSLSELE